MGLSANCANAVQKLICAIYTYWFAGLAVRGLLANCLGAVQKLIWPYWFVGVAVCEAAFKLLRCCSEANVKYRYLMVCWSGCVWGCLKPAEMIQNLI